MPYTAERRLSMNGAARWHLTDKDGLPATNQAAEALVRDLTEQLNILEDLLLGLRRAAKRYWKLGNPAAENQP